MECKLVSRCVSVLRVCVCLCEQFIKLCDLSVLAVCCYRFIAIGNETEHYIESTAERESVG